MSDPMWDQIEGRNYSQGQNDSLIRSLCWGNRGAWDGVAALLAKVHELEDRIVELEATLNGNPMHPYR